MTARKPGAKRGAPFGNCNAYKNGRYRRPSRKIIAYMAELKRRIRRGCDLANRLILRDDRRRMWEFQKQRGGRSAAERPLARAEKYAARAAAKRARYQAAKRLRPTDDRQEASEAARHKTAIREGHSEAGF